MSIRPAVPDDAKSLGEVSSATYRTTYAGMFADDKWLDQATPEYFVEMWKKDLDEQEELGPVVVSEVDGAIVGFASGAWLGERGDRYKELPADAFQEIRELYVLKTFQGPKGGHHGTQLLLALVKLLDPAKNAVAHAAAKNTRIRDYMNHLNAEIHEDGRVVVFQNRNVKIEVPRVTFYWAVGDLLSTLQRIGEPAAQ
jgi:hypothetical protein